MKNSLLVLIALAFIMAIAVPATCDPGITKIFHRNYTQSDPPEWIIKNVETATALKYDRKLGSFRSGWDREKAYKEIIVLMSDGKTIIQCQKSNTHGSKAYYDCFGPAPVPLQGKEKGGNK